MVVVLLLLMLLLPSVSAWYNASWPYRKVITIDRAQVNGTLSNFPLLIRIASDTHLATRAQIDADDLLFANVSNEKLDHELEKYDAVTGELVAWVRIPVLTNSSNTSIYLYYGNSTVASQQNATGVWDSQYKGVYHLGNTTIDGADSTLVNNGTSINMTSGNGQMGTGAYFNGSAYINISNSMFNISNDSITISVWINTTNQSVMTALSQASTNGMGSNFFTILTTFFVRANIVLTPAITSTQALANNTYFYLSISRTPNNTTLYINGLYDTSGDRPVGSATGGIYIGMARAGGSLFNGTMDEVRISSTARTSEWIQTEYNNQKSNSTFLSVSNTNCDSPNGLWTLNASDNCIVDGMTATVTQWTIVGNGTVIIQNSNISYQNKTFAVTAGNIIRLVLGTGARIARTS